MNTPTDSNNPKLRMYAYELTHSTSEQINGYLVTFRCETRAEADAKAAKFAKAKGPDVGFKPKQIMCGD